MVEPSQPGPVKSLWVGIFYMYTSQTEITINDESGIFDISEKKHELICERRMEEKTGKRGQA